jgi:hypothetical protein
MTSMSGAPDPTTQIQLRHDRLRAGDDSARDELLNIFCGRLSRLARKMLRRYRSTRPDALAIQSSNDRPAHESLLVWTTPRGRRYKKGQEKGCECEVRE